jgi:hypothetical protein
LLVRLARRPGAAWWIFAAAFLPWLGYLPAAAAVVPPYVLAPLLQVALSLVVLALFLAGGATTSRQSAKS